MDLISVIHTRISRTFFSLYVYLNWINSEREMASNKDEYRRSRKDDGKISSSTSFTKFFLPKKRTAFLFQILRESREKTKKWEVNIPKKEFQKIAYLSFFEIHKIYELIFFVFDKKAGMKCLCCCFSLITLVSSPTKFIGHFFLSPF